MRHKIVLLLLVFVGSLTSCEEALDVTPENSLTFKNALETEKDLEGALAGAGYYVRFMAQMNFSAQIMKGVYMNYDLYDNYTSSRTMAPDGYDADGMGWERFYKIVAQANVVLHFADQVKMTDARRNVCKGQAYFYKGLVYLELLRRWGDCILVKDEVNLNPQGQSAWTEVIELCHRDGAECRELFAGVSSNDGFSRESGSL